MRLRWLGLALALALIPAASRAGPPFLTDDPQPTDLGHWEIYNFVNGARDAGGLDGEAGLDLNYGAARDLQLTAVLPLGYDKAKGAALGDARVGTGVVELAAKYKILHPAEGGDIPDVAIFPRLFVPTDRRFGTGHVSLLLPVWAQRDFGAWSVFGGGGYTLNPGAGQKDFWQGGITVQRTLSKRLSLGAEVFGQSADTAGGGFSTVNFGATYKFAEHWSLLASGGPTRESGNGHGTIFYLSLKADY